VVSNEHKTFKEYHPAPHREVSILLMVEDHGLPLVVAAEVQEVATADRSLI
jgi:hypothetical protein